MKFCVEAAVSAAQGGTAVRPPPEVRNLTGFVKKKNHFFHSENQLKKKNFCRWESLSVGTEANPSSSALGQFQFCPQPFCLNHGEKRKPHISIGKYDTYLKYTSAHQYATILFSPHLLNVIMLNNLFCSQKLFANVQLKRDLPDEP